MERIRTVRYPGIGFVYNYPDIPMITMAFLFSDWSSMPALDIANKCTCYDAGSFARLYLSYYE